MEFDRELPQAPPRGSKRVNDWFEIYQDFPEEQVEGAGARCMDCGVPFLPQRMSGQQHHS